MKQCDTCGDILYDEEVITIKDEEDKIGGDFTICIECIKFAKDQVGVPDELECN